MRSMYISTVEAYVAPHRPTAPTSPIVVLYLEFPPLDWPELSAGHVHVWKVNTIATSTQLQEMFGILSGDEVERARRLRRVRDRDRFVVCRAALRTLLAGYLRYDPRQLQLSYSDAGQPQLAGEWSGCKLHFSVSHASDLGLLAFSHGRAVGIDIERTRDDLWLDGVAERCFSQAERCALRLIDAHELRDAFFSCWTRKEAYVKATGKGLSAIIDFDVSCSPSEPARLIETRPDPFEACRWDMRDLPVESGYKAAIAVERAASIA